ncbi:cell division protein ZapA [Rheinheimera marina]|uniref:Cell division protein ZapA n=1 Tax=Rheinheimera marina TaxID=1774958 RepID=A0ABV9JKL6_9GAMM
MQLRKFRPVPPPPADAVVKKPVAIKGKADKPKQLTISVLGRVLKVACPVGEEQRLQAAITELETRVANTKYKPGVHMNEDVLLMIALNLCNELVDLKPKPAESSN